LLAVASQFMVGITEGDATSSGDTQARPCCDQPSQCRRVDVTCTMEAATNVGYDDTRLVTALGYPDKCMPARHL
jgi:hypothetical protein